MQMKMMNKKRYLKAVSLLLALILTVSIFPAKRVHAEDSKYGNEKIQIMGVI